MTRWNIGHSTSCFAPPRSKLAIFKSQDSENASRARDDALELRQKCNLGRLVQLQQIGCKRHLHTLTDAHLDTPQQVACQSVNSGGMSSLTSVLNFLRQLGVVVEVSGPPSFIHPSLVLHQPTGIGKYASLFRTRTEEVGAWKISRDIGFATTVRGSVDVSG